MSSITVRNIPEETHRALRVRAALAGRSTEAEVRAILESAARPDDRVKLGSLLAEIGQQAGGAEQGAAVKGHDLEASPGGSLWGAS
jgi:plasmid stability protein